MRVWALRIIGLLNILFAIFALLFEAVALLSGGKFPTKVTPTPMDWVIFALLLAVSNYLVVHPALYGIRLIRKDESALLPCARRAERHRLRCMVSGRSAYHPRVVGLS